ncbi:hypothetical protein NSK_002306 [Nannochloropsis salina CCMP1776]|uniref:Uncharacterized protein n=1 Tax=Nannochloropsis salina CCMP1776 TaxID=1027361 RepID=A0A4D9D509_9STRA|nr:hypothetical protein NSK_002306 [Nannochloropsis salina CCMP1776]|eukprot:TFJ86652.1 hypothetical protein NSK_002306 [Nannochloropsis salina CCMP1776]
MSPRGRAEKNMTFSSSQISSSWSSTHDTKRYNVLLGLALAGLCLTLLLALPHVAWLRVRPPSKIRKFYFAASLLPVVFAVSASITCLAPWTNEYWGLLQHLTEAWALHSLNQLIVERLGGKTSALAKLQARGRQQWLRAPPLCCWCYFLPSTSFTEHTLRLVLTLTRQFIYAAPLLSLLNILLSFTRVPTTPPPLLWHVLRLLLLLSSLLALWGLFILYKASHDDLSRHHQITLKFLSIKLLIIVGIVQEYLFAELMDDREEGREGGKESLAVLVPNALLASESPFLTLLILWAFPLRELDPSFGGEARRSLSLSPGGGRGDGKGGDKPGVIGGKARPHAARPLLGPREGGDGGGRGAMLPEEEERGVGELLFESQDSDLGGITGSPGGPRV